MILAAFVALSHFGLVPHGFNPGQWSVLSFYVVSGFLMEHLFKKLSVGGQRRWFYLDRVMRIFPLFLFLLLVFGIALHHSWRQIGINALLFPLNYTSFTGTALIISPTWSLACEAQFYLLVPFLAVCSTRVIRMMMAASVALFAMSPFLPYSTFWAYQGLPGVLFSFLSGILIRRKDASSLHVAWVVFAGLMAFFVYSKIAHLGLPTGIHINVCAGYLIALPVVSRLALLSPNHKWDQRLGLLSYPLFLVHAPLRDLGCLYHLTQLHMLGWLIVSIAAAVLLVVALERPLDRVRYKLRGTAWRTTFRSLPHSPMPPQMAAATVGHQPRLPSREKCRTRYLGPYLPSSLCLVEEEPIRCEHSLRLGDAILCLHPDRRSFEKPDPLDLSSSR